MIAAEVAIEVEHGAIAATPRDRDRGALLVVSRRAIRHDHVQTVDGAAQEDHHQPLAVAVVLERASSPGMRSEQNDTGGSGSEHRTPADKFAPRDPGCRWRDRWRFRQVFHHDSVRASRFRTRSTRMKISERTCSGRSRCGATIPTKPADHAGTARITVVI